MANSVAGFSANGLITLTTDFGWREPFVGIMKGVMLSRAPRCASSTWRTR